MKALRIMRGIVAAVFAPVLFVAALATDPSIIVKAGRSFVNGLRGK